MSNIDLSSSAYQTWKDKLAIELKGRDLKDYDYTWDGISVSPFDERKGINSNSYPRNNQGWLIGARCEQNNESIVQALQFGAEIVSINILNEDIKPANLFKDIRLDWITLEMNIQDVGNLKNLHTYLKKQKSENTNGIVIASSEKQVDLHSTYSVLLPNYKFLSIECSAFDTAADVAIKFNTLIQHIERLSASDTLHQLLTKVIIRFTAGNDLVLNISMIRALRLVWMHLLKSFNQDISIPITIHTYIKNYGDKPTDNMILSTSASVACVIGGADALFIEAPDVSRSSRAWHLKLQLIMKEESHFDKANDPIGGAHLIERLSMVIAEKIWRGI